MQTTNISWATYSWNPVTGCSHQGPECWNCYAETVSNQQAQRDDPPAGATEKEWTQANAEDVVKVHPDRLEDPYEYGFPEGPGRIFVGSMTDLFHREVDDEFIWRVVQRAAAFPQHIWIFLTKRPDRAAELRLDWPENCWVGTSVGSGPGGNFPNTTHRIEQLRDIDAPVRWVSAEPLIEPLGDLALDHVDWMVVGGESGPSDVRREMDNDWAVDLLEQCREQDVAYYFKQQSGLRPEENTALTIPQGSIKVQAEVREFPELPDVTEDARRTIA